MQLSIAYNPRTSLPVGYGLLITPRETEHWARAVQWPDHYCRGKTVGIHVDDIGPTYCNQEVDDRPGGNGDTNLSDLETLVANFLPPVLHHLWPLSKSPNKEKEEKKRRKGGSRDSCNEVPIETLMLYEDGDMEYSEIVDMFQKLIDSGLVWKLQGCYGRQAQAFLDQGICRAT